MSYWRKYLLMVVFACPVAIVLEKRQSPYSGSWLPFGQTINISLLLLMATSVVGRYVDVASTLFALQSPFLTEGAPGLGPKPSVRVLKRLGIQQARYLFFIWFAVSCFSYYLPDFIFKWVRFFFLTAAIVSFTAAASNMILFFFAAAVDFLFPDANKVTRKHLWKKTSPFELTPDPLWVQSAHGYMHLQRSRQDNHFWDEMMERNLNEVRSRAVHDFQRSRPIFFMGNITAELIGLPLALTILWIISWSNWWSVLMIAPILISLPFVITATDEDGCSLESVRTAIRRRFNVRRHAQKKRLDRSAP